MAKKKNAEEKKHLPSVQEHRMLISPSEMTKLMATLSPLAMEIFVNLLVQFQEKMVEQLNAKAENRQYSLFDDEVIPMVRVQMSGLSVEAYDYHRIEVAVAELFNQVYHTTVRNEWGDEVDRYVRLFQVCEIPKRKLGYYDDDNEERYNYKSGVRRRGYIAMQFTQEAAPLMLTIDKSYTKFLMESLIGWRNKHTAGMVLTLSSVMDLGAWTVKYDDLRRRLGFIKPVLITDSTAKGSTSMYVEKDFGYANFSDMKRRVLDPVMNEVNKGCEEGRAVPFYFEYEPNYMDGKTRGIPKSITFKMHKSDFGRMMKAENERSKEKTEIREFLIKNLKIGKTSAAALSSLINDDNKVGFRKKMEELYGFISDPKNTIKDVGAYCVVALKNWVESNEPVLDKTPTVDAEYEVVSDAAPAQQEQQAPKAETLEERWGRVMAQFRQMVDVKDWRVYFDHSSSIHAVSFYDGKLRLYAPNEQYINEVEGRYADVLGSLIRREFGNDVFIEYTTKEKQ